MRGGEFALLQMTANLDSYASKEGKLPVHYFPFFINRRGEQNTSNSQKIRRRSNDMLYTRNNGTSKQLARWSVALAAIFVALINAQHSLAQAPPEVKAFTPFKVIGNIYYVGDTNECVYLITTSAGHILLDTGFAET